MYIKNIKNKKTNFVFVFASYITKTKTSETIHVFRDGRMS